MRHTIAILLVIQFCACLGQKMEGVYVGEVITPKNVLVVSTKGGKLKGHVYLSEFEKFEFLGNLVADSVKGVIIVPAGSEVILLGTLHKDSIEATIVSSGETKRTTLKHVSSKTTKDLRKYFGDQPAERDPLLVGKWDIVKIISADGKELDRKYFYEYAPNGDMLLDVESIRRQLEESYRRAALQTGEQNKFKWDDRILPKNSWQTRGNKLITVSSSDYVAASQQEYIYQIKNDTLVITNSIGGKEFLVRDKKK